LTNGTSNFHPHPQSPAGLIWEQMKGSYDFYDPYSGEGGFGASSAQFLTAKRFLSASELRPDEILNEYKKIQTGSGYDVVAQLLGGVAHIDASKGVFETFKWPFVDIDFLIFKTGHKVQTHESCPANIEYHKISSQSGVVTSAFLQGDSQNFVESLCDFRDLLSDQALVANSTAPILEDFESDQDVLMAKGCGAMGADVVLVLTTIEKTMAVKKRFDHKLRFVASSKNISCGLLAESVYGVAVEN